MPETEFFGEWDGSVLIRYLPRWLNSQCGSSLAGNSGYSFVTYSNTTYGAEGTLDPLLKTWFESAVPTIPDAQRMIVSFGGHNSLSETTLDVPRLAWALNAENRLPNQLLVGGREVRASIGLFDFMTSPDLVYSAGEDGMLYLRNLATTSITITSSSRSYILPNYIKDEGVWFQLDGQWYRLTPGLDLDSDSGIATLPITGSVLFLLSTPTTLQTVASGEAILDGSGVTITQIDMWNMYDEAAMLAGLERLPGETNKELRNRITAVYLVSPSSAHDGLASSIGRGIGLVGVIPWDGQSTIDFAASGLLNVTRVMVSGLPEIQVVPHELLTRGSLNYHTDHAEWEDGWLLYVDGLRSGPGLWPYPSFSDNHLVFSIPTTGRVEASYSYRNHLFTTSGASAYLAPTANTPENSYFVTYIQDIDLNVVSESNYKRLHLLTSDGRPNENFMALVDTVKSAIPLTVGNVQWGKSAYWFTDEETKPGLINIPIVLE